MTRADVANLCAGRELDVAVGRHVMKVNGPPWLHPFYSSDLYSSRSVMETMRRRGWTFRLVSFPTGGFSAWFEKHLQRIQDPAIELFDEIHNAEADTEPLAICKAALIATMESERR